MTLNILTYFQPIAIFIVFAIKPSTRNKMNRKALRLRRSVMGGKAKKTSTTVNNNKSSISDNTLMTDVGNRNSKRASRISMGMKIVKSRNSQKSSFVSVSDASECVPTSPTSPASPPIATSNVSFAAVSPTNNRG